MPADVLQTEVLVVGSGTGGTAAALQAARAGVQTILVSEGPWLGGMLTAAGVCAPDGNELLAWQTGLWGAFLRELQTRQLEGLDHGWVSFFTYDPRIGAQIFADWVQAEAQLTWLAGQTPQAVLRQGSRVTGVRFDEVTVLAQVVLDGTELGDLLELGAIPYRLGWELYDQWQEPSAPLAPNETTQQYLVQVPTWVVYLQDFGEQGAAPLIPPAPNAKLEQFQAAWQDYSVAQFLSYGQIPGRRFMMNWPIKGNDYGEGVERLFGSIAARQAFLQEARWQSQNFAAFIQQSLGQRYGLAQTLFPEQPGALGGGAFALQPYYRESRRLRGLSTVIEQDLLPQSQGQVATLPRNASGEISAIAIGNYVNDHHYPSGDIPLQPKALRWGGRWTGTPFTLPYGALVPESVDGFLVCEKNISVSHMANGATRLQPVVLGIGQAAGMAAALCCQQGLQPRDLPVRQLQNALLSDPVAPAGLIPLFNLIPNHPDYRTWQHRMLDDPEQYPKSGQIELCSPAMVCYPTAEGDRLQSFEGVFARTSDEAYRFTATAGETTWDLVTLDPRVQAQLQELSDGAILTLTGWPNPAGSWIRVNGLQTSIFRDT
ncbi:MAG: FAD-dependent oxidoreductase [Thermosynechococcaceae cyanobacterium]